MSIRSIRIKNLLSFDELYIENFQDINCIVGKNNVGKSNLLKLIRFFYNKLDGKRELPPTLNSNYSSFGTIEITFDTTRIKSIVTSPKNKEKSKYFKHIYNTLFKDQENNSFKEWYFQIDLKKFSFYTLTLQINSDDSTKWLNTNDDILKVINYLYPFFEIEARHLDLYDWTKLWHIVSRLKSFDVDKIKRDEIIDLFNKKISLKSNNYKDYIAQIEKITQTDKYSYREKVLNYIKAGLQGQTFLINEQSLEIQSDGTNAHKFIEIALELLITLSRREYISPTIYIDEPELGLHPKRNEELIYKLYDVYNKFKQVKDIQEKGKQKTPYPKIIFATHSPNIVKEVIKLFDENQQILYFSKDKNENTKVQKMNSTYEDKRFLNIFSDNEARLFFSNFILFVEGATELEIFSNKQLINKFLNKKEEKFLRFIDIYKMNDVTTKYINPSYANTSIPYLILYDADKFINIDFLTNKLTFKKEIINLNEYITKYQKSYFGSKNYDKFCSLKLLQYFDSKDLNFDSKKLYITNINYYDEIVKNINDNFAHSENYHFNYTTIERVLINDKSINLLLKWLFSRFKLNLKKSYNEKTPTKVVNKIKSQKLKEWIAFRRFIRKNFTEKEKIILFNLIFGGKTETSIATFTNNYSNLESTYRKNLEEIKKTYFKKLNLNDLLGKTSGWTTSFLNFAIDEIEKTRGNKSFREEFKIYFEELYDIITYIEKKL